MTLRVAATADHDAKDAAGSAAREGDGNAKADLQTGVQVTTCARMTKDEARLAEKREFTAFMHAHGITLGMLARWWECSETDAHRVVSIEHPDRNVSRAHIRCLPVSLQRAIAWGDTQRLAAGGSGVLPRTERIVRVARETGDVYRAEGPALIREVDEAIAELQELRRDEMARLVEDARGGAR